MSKRTKRGFILFLVAILICSITSVSAYLTDRKLSENNVTLGQLKTKIVEEFKTPDKLEPNTHFKKVVQIENADNGYSVPCYVRALVRFSTSEMKDFCTLDFNTDDWTYNSSNDYWYYKKKLNSGEKTTPLFTNVKISDTATEENLKDFDIIVYHESNTNENF